MQKWQVISNQSDGANFMPSIEKLMYKQQVPRLRGNDAVSRQTRAFFHGQALTDHGETSIGRQPCSQDFGKTG
ncbi:MAG: hypothetical protein ACKVHE_32715, partial [Planctomycetales bacterium]|jgi:hypothetical protein